MAHRVITLCAVKSCMCYKFLVCNRPVGMFRRGYESYQVYRKKWSERKRKNTRDRYRWDMMDELSGFAICLFRGQCPMCDFQLSNTKPKSNEEAYSLWLKAYRFLCSQYEVPVISVWCLQSISASDKTSCNLV